MNINETLDERAATHGDFYEGADIFKQLFELLAVNRANLTNTQLYALNMIFSKSVRILNGNANEVDHWRDIVGYATLGGKL